MRHEFSRFLIPNELLQEQAGQRQNGDNFETMGVAHFQHILSPDTLVAFAGMVRDNSHDLYSNQKSTPIIAFQHNGFREGYFNGTLSLNRGRHEFKIGVDSDNTWLHEHFNYLITNPAYFDPNTPKALTLLISALIWSNQHSSRIDFLLGNWTISGGLRWDHYQLLVNQNAVSPRLSIGRYIPSLKMVLHASFDRIFGTPSSDNILISSSPQIDALSSEFLRLPVRPSLG